MSICQGTNVTNKRLVSMSQELPTELRVLLSIIVKFY